LRERRPDAEVGVGVAQVITNNLKRSGLFAPIDQAAYIEKITNIDAPPQFQSWKDHQCAGAGEAPHDQAGRRTAEGGFGCGTSPTGQQLSTGPAIFHVAGILAQGSRISFSDQIYERLTGEKGYFRQPAWCSSTRTGPKERRNQAAGIDGSGRFNVRYLTRGSDLVLDAAVLAVDPGNHLYGIRQGDPRVYLLNIETLQREIVGKFSRHVVLAALLRLDGQRVIMKLAAGGQFEPVRDGSAFEIDPRALPIPRRSIPRRPMRPDGDAPVFRIRPRRESRQIYVMPAGGRAGAAASPSAMAAIRPRSGRPRGDYIAFTKQGSGQFSIGINEARWLGRADSHLRIPQRKDRPLRRMAVS